MEETKNLLDMIVKRLGLATIKDAVVSKPISMGEAHMVVLSELSFGYGGGGGGGEAAEGKGQGMGAGGGAQANPVAVILVEKGKVRLELVGQ